MSLALSGGAHLARQYPRRRETLAAPLLRRAKRPRMVRRGGESLKMMGLIASCSADREVTLLAVADGSFARTFFTQTATSPQFTADGLRIYSVHRFARIRAGIIGNLRRSLFMTDSQRRRLFLGCFIALIATAFG